MHSHRTELRKQKMLPKKSIQQKEEKTIHFHYVATVNF